MNAEFTSACRRTSLAMVELTIAWHRGRPGRRHQRELRAAERQRERLLRGEEPELRLRYLR